MAQLTPEDQAAFNEIMQVLEVEPTETTTTNPLVSITNDINIRSLQFWFRRANPKKPSVCSAPTSR